MPLPYRSISLHRSSNTHVSLLPGKVALAKELIARPWYCMPPYLLQLRQKPLRSYLGMVRLRSSSLTPIELASNWSRVKASDAKRDVNAKVE